MVNSQRTSPSQAEIGRALGLSPATMSKYKAMGMPTDSVQAVRAWRNANIKPTAHKMMTKRTPRPAPPLQPSGAIPHALALLDIAAAALEAGQSIAAMVPTLRAALHAVPEHERNAAMLLPLNVMNVLVAEMVNAMAVWDKVDGRTHSSEPMTEEDADFMGRWWFEVAAGEVRPT
jgi:hypothetical protein